MGHKDTVELLVQKGAQVDSKNNVSTCIIFILRSIEKCTFIYTIVVTVISDNFPVVLLQIDFPISSNDHNLFCIFIAMYSKK